ncbi:unnamed protein product [Paramecium sonneborni]|uniref:Protein kinase domain-containing protein n=1 Tax=Paramecium sonneborni TaxID=65129 RepID=A0A8S1P0S6_9CILI|nr:unnamed protein product [Paramecium sonneborni]
MNQRLINGNVYENVRKLNQHGAETDNFIANIKGNENEEFVIKQYKTINEAELLAIKEIKRLQNEQEPKCLNIIKIIELQDNRRISQAKDILVYVVLEKGKNNVEELIKSISFTILSQQQKLNYFAQMLQGVKELHDIGYFHRDLKPENFVYFENSNQEIQIKLIDFGQVKSNNDKRNTLQRGTFNYMAPEVGNVNGNTNYDKTADIWSLGIICYEMLTKADFLKDTKSKDFTRQLSNLTQELVNERIKNTNNIDDFTKSLLLQMLQIQGDKRAELKSLIDQIIQKEKENFQSQIDKLKKFFDSFEKNINKKNNKINFYTQAKFQIFRLKKIQDDISDYEKMIKNFVDLQKQENMINQYWKSQQLIKYQSFNKKIKEYYRDQKRLESSIKQADNIIVSIDQDFYQFYKGKINKLIMSLKDNQKKFENLSDKYKEYFKINQIITKIEMHIKQLNDFNQQLDQGEIKNYQQLDQIMDQINRDQQEFEKLHQNCIQKVLVDRNVEVLNNIRKQKLTNIEGQLEVYKDQMDKLKIQINNFINNQYCDNQFTKDLIKNKQIKIDQNISQFQEQFTNFKEFNQFTLEEINNQIKQLEQFEEKLKKQLEDEQEQANQLQQQIFKIGADIKSNQVKEIKKLTEELQQKQKEFTNALQSFNIAQEENIQQIKQIQEKRKDLYNQLLQEVDTLQNYSKVNQSNQELFGEVLKELKTTQGSVEDFEEMVIKQQKYNQEKTKKLEFVLKNVKNKPSELQFNNGDNNLIYQYEQLIQKEQQIQQEINDLISQEQNQQLNPEVFNQMKNRIENLKSEIDNQIQQIPKDNEIKQQVKKELENYKKLYVPVNYIIQYHLTRYCERIKENADKMKNKQQNEQMAEYTQKENEAQDLLKIYENILFDKQNKQIDEMERDYKQIQEHIQDQENFIKQKNNEMLDAALKDIQEIINEEYYYKIPEFTQMLIFQRIFQK